MGFKSIEMLHTSTTFRGILLANKMLTENLQLSTPFNLMEVQIPFLSHVL
jgi:hypothetical protein